MKRCYVSPQHNHSLKKSRKVTAQKLTAMLSRCSTQPAQIWSPWKGVSERLTQAHAREKMHKMVLKRDKGDVIVDDDWGKWQHDGLLNLKKFENTVRGGGFSECQHYTSKYFSFKQYQTVTKKLLTPIRRIKHIKKGKDNNFV